MNLAFIKKFSFADGTAWSLVVLWASLTFSPAIMNISFFTALICWVGSKIQNNSLRINIPRALTIPLTVFLLICVSSFFWSDFPKQSFKGVTKTLEQVLIFLMTAEVFAQHKNMRRFEKGFIATLSVLVVNGYFQYAFGFDFIRHIASQDSSAGARISASFKTYGLLGCFILSTLPYLFLLGLRYRNKEKKWFSWYLAFPVSIGAFFLLFLTRSRGAILAFVLGTVAVLLYKRKWQFLLIVFLSFAGLVSILPPSMVIHLDSQRKEQSLVERFYLWDRALHVIKAEPLLGTGINTYTVAHAKYDKTQNWRVKNYYAHNGYLQMGAEIGIIGLSSFLLFLLMIFISGFKAQRLVKDVNDRNVLTGVMGGLINFLVFAMVDTIMHNPQSILTLWFLLGIYTAYQQQLCPRNKLDHAS